VFDIIGATWPAPTLRIAPRVPGCCLKFLFNSIHIHCCQMKVYATIVCVYILMHICNLFIHISPLLPSHNIMTLDSTHALISTVHYLVMFYCDRLRDRAVVVPHVLYGLHALVGPTVAIACLLLVLFANMPLLQMSTLCREYFFWIEIILSHYGRKSCTEGQAYVGAPLVTTS